VKNRKILCRWQRRQRRSAAAAALQDAALIARASQCSVFLCSLLVFLAAVLSGILTIGMLSPALRVGVRSRALSVPPPAPLLLLLLIFAWGRSAAASATLLPRSTSLLSTALIVLNTSISAQPQSFDAEAAATSSCASTMHGYSVLQLVTSFGDAPRQTDSSVLLGISKITLELWCPAGDSITDRFEVEGTAPVLLPKLLRCFVTLCSHAATRAHEIRRSRCACLIVMHLPQSHALQRPRCSSLMCNLSSSCRFVAPPSPCPSPFPWKRLLSLAM
jgi:hypothetical protein